MTMNPTFLEPGYLRHLRARLLPHGRSVRVLYYALADVQRQLHERGQRPEPDGARGYLVA